MNTALIILILVGVFALGWKWLDTRAKVAASPGYGKRMGVFYLLSAFTILVGITTVFADALFELLGLEKPAHFELMSFGAFIVFCVAAVLILREKRDQLGKAKNSEISVGGDVGALVNKPEGPVNIKTGIDKKKVLTGDEPPSFSMTDRGLHVQGDARNVVYGTANFISQAPKIIPKWLTNYPRFDERLIGREQDLQQLAQMLEESKNVVLVNGMGGIGKTTLAIAYLDRFKDQYDHIVWLEQLGDFTEALLTNELLLQNLGVISISAEPVKDVNRILNQLGNISGRCLLVIDNADERLQPYRAHLPRDWHVLITSRQDLDFPATFGLDFLDEESALELFYEHCEDVKGNELVQEIISTVGYHTLTIELLAKTAARKKHTLSIENLWQNIQERGLRLGKEINITTAHSRHKSIRKILPYLCSIFELQDLAEEEEWLLLQFACLPPVFHTFEDLRHLLQVVSEEDIEQLEESLLQLKEKGWLLADRKGDAYKMHRIIMDVVLAQISIEEQDILSLLLTLLEVTRYRSDRNPIEQFRWIPHLKHLLEILNTKPSERTGYLLANLAGLYRAQGNQEEAFTHCEKSLRILEVVLHKLHPALAASYHNLAMLHQDHGRYEEAFTFHQESIRIREIALGPQHPSMASSYNLLASLHQAQGRYEEAFVYYQKAIEILESLQNAFHPDLATSYNNIASLLSTMGSYETALTFYKKAINIREAILDPMHPDLAVAYTNIAMLYKDQRQYQEAFSFLRKALEIREAILDPMHPDLAAAYHNLAGFYQALGDHDNALKFYKKAIEIREVVLNPQHQDLATSYHNLGRIYQDQGHNDKALTYFQIAINIWEAVLDSLHPYLATAYISIARVYRSQGRYADALPFVQKAIKIREAVLNPFDSDMAISYNEIGLLYRDLGQSEKALISYKKALKVYRASLGEQHPNTQIVNNNLKVLLSEIEKE